MPARIPLENTVAMRPSRRSSLPHALWWQPGVYGSMPAVLLWIMARLPAEMLAAVFGTPAASALLNHAGDTLFVTGWVASAAWLWFTRRRRPPGTARAPGSPASSADAAKPTGHEHHRAG